MNIYKLRLTVTSILFTLFFSTVQSQDSKNQIPQFLYPQFSKGILKMKNGSALSAVINYNMVDQEFIFEQRGTYMALDKPDEIDTVVWQGKKFIYLNKAFIELAYKGKISIFYQHKAKYTSAGSKSAYGMTSQTTGPTAVLTIQGGNQMRSLDLPENVTVSLDDIFWIQENGTFKKFTSERQFAKLFPEKEDQIKQFCKSNKINLTKVEDLQKLGDWVNK